jgi:hypothetical protein
LRGGEQEGEKRGRGGGRREVSSKLHVAMLSRAMEGFDFTLPGHRQEKPWEEEEEEQGTEGGRALSSH